VRCFICEKEYSFSTKVLLQIWKKRENEESLLLSKTVLITTIRKYHMADYKQHLVC
jgi:hypothetical protein